MNVSQARIDANQRNAQKSTGPRTQTGKENSRANALAHGLCSSTLVPEDAAVVFERASEFFDTLKPQNHFHCWLVREISLITFKIDRASRIDRRVRDKIAIKAELCWDDDKRLEAELLGEQLANRPAVVIEQLQKTPQGCEWLMGRWARLAYVADEKKAWTPALEQLAFDLLATPKDFREGHKPGVSLDFRGNVLDRGLDLAEVARREIDALEERRELVRGLDQANRALAMADLHDDADAELKRTRKYEGALHSRLRWCLRQLQEEAPIREAPRWLKKVWLGFQAETATPAIESPPLPKPTPLPEPVAVEEAPPEWANQKTRQDEIHPSIDLEPEEYPAPGEKADITKILANRHEKKLQKAESRREAKRRKAEKLRA